jgi:type IV secretory pathway VirB10-like protein
MRVAGVRRLNRKPIYILGGVALAVLGILCWVAAERGSQQAKPVQDDHGGSATEYAQELAGDRLTGVVAPAREPTPAPVQVSAPAATVAAPSAPVAAPTPDEMQRRRMEAYLAALKAKPGVEGDGFQQIAQKRTQQLDAQQVAMLRKADPNNAADASITEPVEVPNGNPQDPNDLANFQGPRNRWALNSTVQRPATPYVIQPGWKIFAALETGVNSELPGMITARVTRNVYDSPTGRYLLIPQGSTLVGEYASKIEYGQGRVFVAFQRINFPDGTWLDIGAMSGADGQGQAGLHDLTDTHFFRTFGEAILMSGITAGVALSQGPQQFSPYGQSQSFSGELSQSLGQNVGGMMAELFHKNINVSPTLKLRPGFVLTVLANKDLVFPKPYRVSQY